MPEHHSDWFVSHSNPADIGSDYEAKALKNHKYYVKVKSLHLLKKVEEFYGDLKNLDCVDLGCGTAETDEYFQDKFRHIFCCDYSAGMLEYAAKKNLRNVTFKLCQSERLPFDNDSVDIVLMYGLIHHIDTGEKIVKTFNEASRILKKGGIVVVYDFNPLNPVSRYIVRNCPIDSGVNLDGYRRSVFPTTFYLPELVEELKNAGFIIGRKEFLLFFPKILSALLPLEPFLAGIPFGGMYSVMGIK
ncbi:MAG: class I SAM-dependent methyltransferase [Candidatus Omnitrophota bacterium]|jgi:SAM-dependent methyltransferase